MVYLLTEGATTPHSMRRGRTAISLLNAYGEIVMNLVSLGSRQTPQKNTDLLLRRSNGTLNGEGANLLNWFENFSTLWRSYEPFK